MELFVDLETQNRPYMGSKASPFCPENYIVAPGWAIGDGEIFTKYFHNRAEADADDWCNQALEASDIFVAHNFTFECHWMLHRHYDAFMAFLKRGGRIYCTQLAEYILTHQTHTYPSLEECSLKYGGSKKIDEVKILWEQGFLTSQIEQSLLLKYLGDPEEGDIANTRKVYYAQWPQIIQNNMVEMMWWRMEALLFNAISTFNGLYVDREVAAKNHAEQLARVSELRAKLNQTLPADMPVELEFNWGSGHHTSALFFGGPIKYDKKVPYDPPKYEKADFYKLTKDGATKYYALDWKQDGFSALIADGWEPDVYSRGKSKGSLKVHALETATEKLKWGEDIYEFEGIIKFSDLPTHVAEQYIGKRAEFRGKATLCDGITPVYSTGSDSLDLLAAFSDAAKPIKELASLEKDIGSFYLTHEYNAKGEIKKSKGMLQYVEPDGIVHYQLNGTSTITGRLSSSKPNMQQLPRDGTSKVKEMFTSRFGADGRIVEVDYTALEVVCLAAASGDAKLLEMLLNGTDMHCYRLAFALNEPYEEVLLKCKDETHPEHKKYKGLRTGIKSRSFAAQYGASAQGISFATGCTIEEAEAFLANEAKLFPESIAVREVIRTAVELSGSTPYAIHREMTDEGGFITFRRGHYQAPSGTCYSFRQYPQWRDGQQIMDYKPTQIANYWVQGEASLIVQVACGLVVRWLIENDFFEGNILPISTVHDAIYLDCTSEEWAIFGGQCVKQLMEYTPKYMVEQIPALKEWRYDTTPFPAAAEQGKSMHNKHHIE